MAWSNEIYHVTELLRDGTSVPLSFPILVAVKKFVHELPFLLGKLNGIQTLVDVREMNLQ